MNIPVDGFAIVIRRLRVQSRGSGSGVRYRTVGDYKCYLNGDVVNLPNMSGASVEPKGPGDNSQSGVTYSRRIEEGTYQLGTHGFGGSRYHTFGYSNNSNPRPGVYVHDTGNRSAILIHRGSGFKASVGCINLTRSIAGPGDNISTNNSFIHLDAFISFMKSNLPGFPTQAGRRIENAWLIIEGEP